LRCDIGDIDKVANVLMDKTVYPFTIEDGPKVFPIWRVLSDKNTYTLMPDNNTVAIFLPECRTIYDFHFNALKPSRGQTAIDSAKSVISYMFNRTRCTVLYSIVPVIYSHVIRFYSNVDMKNRGFARSRFLKNGKLHPQIIFSLTKEK